MPLRDERMPHCAVVADFRQNYASGSAEIGIDPGSGWFHRTHVGWTSILDAPSAASFRQVTSTAERLTRTFASMHIL